MISVHFSLERVTSCLSENNLYGSACFSLKRKWSRLSESSTSEDNNSNVRLCCCLNLSFSPLHLRSPLTLLFRV
ncbi:hypothetical protein RJT34_24458 [Clitoria ternatea]|uniref:Uncharacterized protein n=1 Tax=Clitoria ternatea TaxID=43366 RepID=A0AAN9FQT2_CLITE